MSLDADIAAHKAGWLVVDTETVTGKRMRVVLCPDCRPSTNTDPLATSARP